MAVSGPKFSSFWEDGDVRYAPKSGHWASRDQKVR